MKKIILATVCYAMLSTAYAQDNCEVALAAIKGSYTGDCKSNKAEGTGTATGTDVYTGKFKKGLPDGEGTYTWKNGDSYTGSWEKGKRNGQGTFIRKDAGKADVKQVGFWKDDQYVGAYEKPYKILLRTPKVNMFQIIASKTEATPNIDIVLTSVSSSSSTQHLIREIKTINGKFVGDLQFVAQNPRGSTYRLNQVTYPIRCKIITSTGQEAEFEIYQPGRWVINLGINE